MSSVQERGEPETGMPEGEVVDLRLEVVVIPVSDVDRAKAFYAGLGWRLDADVATGDDFRVVQLTPPGSPCSIIFGTGLTSAGPGSAQGLHLIVPDIDVARAELLEHGAEVSEVFGDHEQEDVVGEHVGQADQSRLTVTLLGMVALDHAGDRARHAPATGEDAADQSVVDAEFAALALEAILRRARVTVNLAGIAGIGVDQDELADVVQQRGDHQPVAILVADLAGQAIGRPLGGHGVQSEALGDALPDGGALEEVKRARAAGDRVDRGQSEDLDAADGAVDPALVGTLDLVGQAHDGDGQGHVSLDGIDDVAG
jgi:catechol 2,3-dioxygenase-like lactoylglutathione lyase family enzyme